jgi:hypothetical protein
VQVGGDLGALLRPDALGALGGERVGQPPPEGREDEAEGGDGHERRQRDVAEAGKGTVRV